MPIPTEKTQAKLREIIHAQICNALICKGPDVDWDRSPCHRMSTVMLGLLMPEISAEMFPAVRDDMRQRIHDTIVGELVCCDLYEKAEQVCQERKLNPMVSPKEVVRHFTDMPWHDMCYFGGWAASLAIKECPSGRRKCEPSYWCPSSGEWESPCHGGFDVCCDHPERHQMVGAATPDGA